MNRLRELRRAAGLTQAELAERINVTQPQITNLEMGKRKITADYMGRLAGALHCEPSDIISEPAPQERLADFATRLYTARKASGFVNTSALCAHAEIRATRYMAIEAAEAEPAFDEIIRLALALNVSTDYLLLGSMPRPGSLEEPAEARFSTTLHDKEPSFRARRNEN